jgi:hypothetical protein
LNTIFVAHIAQIELQTLQERLDGIFQAKKLDIASLVREFNKYYCEKTLYTQFASMFASSYQKFLKSFSQAPPTQGLTKSELNIILLAYNKFIEFFSPKNSN